jgi:16S rRNA (adenine(1408)-N(1))-methyltransferase
VIVDIGTGDGAAVIRGARRSPTTLHIGVDSDASSMREASRRAARPVAKRGLPNALFVVAAAEALPEELRGRADRVAVTLPWGSLLRAVLRPSPPVVAALGGLLRAGGRLDLLVSTSDRDRGLPTLDDAAWRRLVEHYLALGFVPCEVRPATVADVAASGSSWAKRLGIPARRAAWWASFERAAGVGGTEAPPPRV